MSGGGGAIDCNKPVVVISGEEPESEDEEVQESLELLSAESPPLKGSKTGRSQNADVNKSGSASKSGKVEKGNVERKTEGRRSRSPTTRPKVKVVTFEGRDEPPEAAQRFSDESGDEEGNENKNTEAIAFVWITVDSC